VLKVQAECIFCGATCLPNDGVAEYVSVTGPRTGPCCYACSRSGKVDKLKVRELPVPDDDGWYDDQP